MNTNASNADQGIQMDADAVLRRLARRALGLSGADIERLVREARQRARHERRQLVYADLDRLLYASRPGISPGHRRRMAVHEAGHALARILLKVGELKLITIDGVEGGYTEVFSSPSSFDRDLIDAAETCERHLVVTMAGRAAEQVVYGSAHAGSGGSMHSDLARATELATAMESSFGFGRNLPLLYRDPVHWQALIRQDRQLARRVHRRLEHAEAGARRLMRRHRSQLVLIAGALEAHGTLEGPELATLVDRMKTGRAF